MRVIVVGLGAIGSMAAEECVAHAEFEVIGAVDPLHVGKEIAGLEVVGSLPSAHNAQVALLCTASTLSDVAPVIEGLVASDLDVVSTCEELTLPSYTDRVIAARLDKRARAAGRTILGCGVNPGLMMDVLPAVLGSASLRPTKVRVSRRVNLDRRRRQLSSKLGVGRAATEWQAIQERNGPFGHIGLLESAHLLALSLGWTVESEDFSRIPLVAKGSVIGVKEAVALAAHDGKRIDLSLMFEAGANDTDEVEIDGEPIIRLVVEGGVQGDTATVARLLAGARVVQAMPSGLRLSIEAPVWTTA